jgi:hypothetical protein
MLSFSAPEIGVREMRLLKHGASIGVIFYRVTTYPHPIITDFNGANWVL